MEPPPPPPPATSSLHCWPGFNLHSTMCASLAVNDSDEAGGGRRSARGLMGGDSGGGRAERGAAPAQSDSVFFVSYSLGPAG